MMNYQEYKHTRRCPLQCNGRLAFDIRCIPLFALFPINHPSLHELSFPTQPQQPKVDPPPHSYEPAIAIARKTHCDRTNER